MAAWDISGSEAPDRTPVSFIIPRGCRSCWALIPKKTQGVSATQKERRKRFCLKLFCPGFQIILSGSSVSSRCLTRWGFLLLLMLSRKVTLEFLKAPCLPRPETHPETSRNLCCAALILLLLCRYTMQAGRRSDCFLAWHPLTHHAQFVTRGKRHFLSFATQKRARVDPFLFK